MKSFNQPISKAQLRKSGLYNINPVPAYAMALHLTRQGERGLAGKKELLDLRIILAKTPGPNHSSKYTLK